MRSPPCGAGDGAGLGVIRLIRNTLRYASYRDWDAMSKDLRPVYTAPTEPAAARLAEFTER